MAHLKNLRHNDNNIIQEIVENLIKMVDFNEVARNLFRAPCQDKLMDYQISRAFFKQMRAAPRKEERLEPFVHTEQERIRIQEKMETDTRLLIKKEEALRIADRLANEKKDLYEKEKAFQENIKKFNSLIIQNRDKRERVVARTKELTSTIERRQEDIEKISIEIQKMKEYKTSFTKEIDKYIIYQDFMEKIFQDFDKKISYFDVIHRYMNLNSKREYVSKIDMDNYEQFKALQLKAVNCTREHHERILELRKQLAVRLTEYDKTKTWTLELEISLIDLCRDCSARLERFVQCVFSIFNLNEQIRQRKTEALMTVQTSGAMEKLGNVPTVLKNLVHVNTTVIVLGNVAKSMELCLRTLRRLSAKYTNYPIKELYEAMTKRLQ